MTFTFLVINKLYFYINEKRAERIYASAVRAKIVPFFRIQRQNYE